jgi:hypothetical protein
LAASERNKSLSAKRSEVIAMWDRFVPESLRGEDREYVIRELKESAELALAGKERYKARLFKAYALASFKGAGLGGNVAEHIHAIYDRTHPIFNIREGDNLGCFNALCD